MNFCLMEMQLGVRYIIFKKMLILEIWAGFNALWEKQN